MFHQEKKKARLQVKVESADKTKVKEHNRRPRPLSQVKASVTADMKRKDDSHSPSPQLRKRQKGRKVLVQEEGDEDDFVGGDDEEEEDEAEAQQNCQNDHDDDDDNKGSGNDSNNGDDDGEEGGGDEQDNSTDVLFKTDFASTRQNKGLAIQESDLDSFVTGLLKDWHYCNRPTVSSDTHLVASTSKKFVRGCHQVYVSGCLASSVDVVARMSIALRGMYEEFTRARGDDDRESQGILGWVSAMKGEI